MRSASFSSARFPGLLFCLLLTLVLAGCGISQPDPVSIRIASASWQMIAAPLYNLASEQMPEDTFALRVYQNGAGHSWSELPPLPVPGMNKHKHGLLQVLAITDDGRLLAFGVDPKAGLSAPSDGMNTQNMPAFWLWIWNPTMAHWQVLFLPLAQPASAGCGLCWSASLSTGSDHMTYLTVEHALEINNPGSCSHLYRMRIPGA